MANVLQVEEKNNKHISKSNEKTLQWASHYSEDFETKKITLLYRGKKQRSTKIGDQQNYLVIEGFVYIKPLCNEVPLNSTCKVRM